MQNLLSTTEAAKFLNISQQTLITYSRTGKIAASFLARRWRYRLEDLHDFITATRRSS
jgi:excisionase family DNA binding protein